MEIARSCSIQLQLGWLEIKAWNHLKTSSLTGLGVMLLSVETGGGSQTEHLHVTSPCNLSFLTMSSLGSKSGHPMTESQLDSYDLASVASTIVYSFRQTFLHKGQLNFKGRENRLYP